MSTLDPLEITPEQRNSAVKAFNDFAFVVPLEKFVYKLDGKWQHSTPVGLKSIIQLLRERGLARELIQAGLDAHAYRVAYGFETLPNQADISTSEAEGRAFLNLWVPPTLTPAPGPHPTIDRIIDFLCGHDLEGVRWLTQWVAYKIQNPGALPKVATLFLTQPGAGKNVLFRIIESMLGPDNCANLKRSALENNFNSHWATKLFVLADEITSGDDVRNITDRLKILIDSPRVELEGKYTNQKFVTNRIAWMFASNDRVIPLSIEPGDRRYTVFRNMEPIAPEYKALLDGCFGKDRHAFTPEFEAEVRGFWADLLKAPVDLAGVFRPYQNEARTDLIHAGLPGHELFFEHVRLHGIDSLLEDVMRENWNLQQTRGEWDMGEYGVSCQVVYEAYRTFCRKAGVRGTQKINRFGIAMRNHAPEWTKARVTNSKKKQVYVYVVPRAEEVAVTPVNAKPTTVAS